jgi:hypothetical protein
VHFHGNSDQRLAQRAAAGGAGFGASDQGLVDLDDAGQQVPTRTHHRRAVLVQDGPGRLVAAQLQHPLQPLADTPAVFWLVMYQPAANHVVNSVRVRSKIVPEVTDTRR